jgi:hypothetical protein
MGMVTEIDLDSGHIRLKDDDEAFCTLCCGGSTQLLADGQPLGLGGLRAGDYVRGECTLAEDGGLLVSEVVLLRPAWRMLESPEM